MEGLRSGSRSISKNGNLGLLNDCIRRDLGQGAMFYWRDTRMTVTAVLLFVTSAVTVDSSGHSLMWKLRFCVIIAEM